MIRTPSESAIVGRASEAIARECDTSTVWYPEHPVRLPAAGARLEIKNRRIRQLAVHHLGQHGRLGHGESSAGIRVYTPGEPLEPNMVYIAATIHDVTELVCLTARLRPIGLLAPADLRHLPAVTSAVLSGVSSRGPAADAIGTASATLTPRNLIVLDLVAQGLTNSEIAAQLNFSLSTVKRDVTELFDWFRVSSRRDLARAARGLGLIPSPYGGLDTTDRLDADDFAPLEATTGSARF